ncbi:hypothetical protein D3C80_1584960 [compost metagenome]
MQLAIKFQHRARDAFKCVVPQEPPCYAAQHREQRGHKSVVHGAVGFCQNHRQKQNVGRNEKNRAFNKGHDCQPPNGGFAARKSHGPVIQTTQHSKTFLKSKTEKPAILPVQKAQISIRHQLRHLAQAPSGLSICAHAKLRTF